MQQSMSLEYEPSSEPLHISAKWLFLICPPPGRCYLMGASAKILSDLRTDPKWKDTKVAPHTLESTSGQIEGGFQVSRLIGKSRRGGQVNYVGVLGDPSEDWLLQHPICPEGTGVPPAGSRTTSSHECEAVLRRART